MLILASIAAILSVLIGGLSQGVAVYMVSAGFLGVFFALQSGTLESVVYDTVLEETGGNDAFEKTMRCRHRSGPEWRQAWGRSPG